MEYGLIGERLGHSYSREIHERITPDPYELHELAPGELADFFAARAFRGINVTIPYKQAVIPYLDGISEQAKAIGAVNTVVNRDGKLFGYNTDFIGMKTAIEAMGVSLVGEKVLIPGTGGTSKTAAAVARALGAQEIIRASRSGRDGGIPYDEAIRLHGDAGFLINTTPVGMSPDSDGVPIALEPFSRLRGVFDAVYHPLRTNLVLDALERGIPASGGLCMLVAQAVSAAALFRGTEPEMSLCGDVYRALKAEKENLVLVGMPSCG